MCKNPRRPDAEQRQILIQLRDYDVNNDAGLPTWTELDSAAGKSLICNHCKADWSREKADSFS